MNVITDVGSLVPFNFGTRTIDLESVTGRQRPCPRAILLTEDFDKVAF